MLEPSVAPSGQNWVKASAVQRQLGAEVDCGFLSARSRAGREEGIGSGVAHVRSGGKSVAHRRPVRAECGAPKSADQWVGAALSTPFSGSTP